MNLEALRTLCAAGEIMVTQHCMKRMTERNIELSRVVGTVIHGEIVEDYPTDYPFPSCLMLYDGLHVVAGLGDGKAWLITAYIPSRDEWESDLKTRRTKQ